MKLDERFMTILTALLVLVGMGALMNRGENGTSIFGGSGTYEPHDDSFTLRAGRVQALDVLLNDRASDMIDPAQLAITQDPHCGMALAANGVIQYSESQNCSGNVVLAYCVPFEGECLAANVTLTILNKELEDRENRPDDGSPMVFDVIAQGNAPQEQPQIAMKQPMRLTLPSNAEVITPAEAAEEIRRIGEAQPTVMAENSSDSAVRVSNTSARSGSVSTSSVSMSAPSMGDESLEIALAQPSAPSRTPPRSAAPGGLSMDVAGLNAPSSPGISSAPSRPASPSSQARPSAPASPSADPVIAAPSPAPAAPVAEPAPAETAVASAAPDAQLNQPAAPQSPDVQVQEDSGVIASLARSNTVLGATVSAAKALFAPESRDAEKIVASSNTSAPRPDDFDIVSGLGSEVTVAAAQENKLPGVDRRPNTLSGVDGIAFASLDIETGYTPKTRPATPIMNDAETGLSGVDQTTEPEGEVVAALAPEADPAADGRTTVGEVDAKLCEVEMSLQVRSGAEIVGTLSSPCRPSEPFLVDHAGLNFTAFTDADGVANFVVPAMQTDAVVAAKFEDGGSAVAKTTVDNMSRMTRVAVMWSEDLDFDLDALEFGARPGTAEHIRRDNTSDYRTARRSGGGYLTTLGPQSGEGYRAEVYTIFQSSRTPGGIIDLEVTLMDHGDACPDVATLRTLRSESAELVRDRDILVNLGACNEAQEVVVGRALRDIRIARN